MKREIKRRSPVVFEPRQVEETVRGEWTVVQEYENEGRGPHLVDLSHCPRWDLQDAGLGQCKPLGMDIPEQPGDCAIQNQVMINRMNNTQAAIWHLTGDVVETPEESGFTEVTDVTVFLAIIGGKVFDIAEKLTALDLSDPAKKAPFLIQGPFAHVPCQIVVAVNKEESPAILLTCSRGYAHDMVEAILDAGSGQGLRPAGESAFDRWLS